MHRALLRASIVSAGLVLAGCHDVAYETARLKPRAVAVWDEGVGLVRITYAIAKHAAIERQRAVARANARRAVAAHGAELRGRNVRYIAVSTSRTPDSTGETSCMLWDTQNEQLVGNAVYDCKTQPAQGSTTKFDSYSAEYVGR